MSRQDQFPDSEDEGKTIIRPSPGGYRRQPLHKRPPPLPRPDFPEIDFEAVSTFNPLTSNALSLLILVPRLRNLAFHESIGELQQRLVNGIKIFQNRSLQMGASERQVEIASYFICSLFDETVLNTPWGSQSNWGHESLLVKFHSEAWGGEEFFEMLSRLMQRPSQNLDLLELAYVCLSLGFEGEYRLRKDGRRELDRLRLELYLTLQRVSGEPDRQLSVHWQGLRDLRNPFTRHVPLWVVAAFSGFLLLIVYLGFSYWLSNKSGRLYGEWMKLADEAGPAIPEPQMIPLTPVKRLIQPKPDPTPSWKEELSDEIARGRVEVLDGPLLRITSAFASGSDRVRDEFIPLLTTIARQLKGGTSRVEVIGHTDNVPIFTARFPSNWDLSNARAKRVADMLDPHGSLGERITFKGRAENDPVAPNDTPEHRALNRRIDIYIR